MACHGCIIKTKAYLYAAKVTKVFMASFGCIKKKKTYLYAAKVTTLWYSKASKSLDGCT